MSVQNGCGVQAIPRDTQGRYTPPAGTTVSSGDTILVSQHNPFVADVAQALTNSLDRNGSGGMLSNLGMNGRKITGMAPGTNPTDAATVAQLVSNDPTNATQVSYGASNVAVALDAAIPAVASVQAALPLSATAPQLLNLTPRPILRPNRTMQDAILSGTVTIAVVGDSIMEPAGVPYADSVAENLQRMLQAKMPWLTINLVNLSIPGRSMSNLASASYTAPGSFTLNAGGGSGALNTSYWPGGSTSGKTWRDHVKDASPDLIVLALGENDGDDVQPFSINTDTFISYSQTWTKKPWFALVSSLIPEGSAATRSGKQAIADFMRYRALEQGYGLIDANAFYRLLRDGVRRELVPYAQESAFQYWGDASRWSVTGSLALASGSVSGAGLALRNVAARDVDLTTDFTLTGNNAILRLDCRNRPTESGYSYQADFAGGFGRLYYRGTLQAAPSIPTKTAGQTVNVRLSAKGPLIQVWHDRTLVLSVSRAFGIEAGPLSFGTAAGAGSFSNFLLTYTTEYQAAQPFFSAAYLLNDNLHHPTGDGAFQTYIPATKQFVDEFADLATRPMVASKGRFTSDLTLPESGTQVLTETAVSFRMAGERLVPVRITFGYKNPFTLAATLTVRLDGTGVATYPLAPTTGTENRAVTFNADVLIGAGQHTLDLTFTAATGTTAGNGVTSTGQFNDRQLSAWVEQA